MTIRARLADKFLDAPGYIRAEWDDVVILKAETGVFWWPLTDEEIYEARWLG